MIPKQHGNVEERLKETRGDAICGRVGNVIGRISFVWQTNTSPNGMCYEFSSHLADRY